MIGIAECNNNTKVFKEANVCACKFVHVHVHLYVCISAHCARGGVPRDSQSFWIHGLQRPSAPLFFFFFLTTGARVCANANTLFQRHSFILWGHSHLAWVHG